MQIILAESCGFCRGVEHSLAFAEEAKEKFSRLFCLHPLIHNDAIVKKLDIPLINSAEDMQEGDALIVSAHGADPATLNALKEKGVLIIDATCPFVNDIHNKVRKYAEEGYEVIILGDKNHAEVIGTAGWCKGRCQVVTEPEEIDFSRSDKYVLTAQSTYDSELFDKQAKKISDLIRNSKKHTSARMAVCTISLETSR